MIKYFLIAKTKFVCGNFGIHPSASLLLRRTGGLLESLMQAAGWVYLRFNSANVGIGNKPIAGNVVAEVGLVDKLGGIHLTLHRTDIRVSNNSIAGDIAQQNIHSRRLIIGNLTDTI